MEVGFEKLNGEPDGLEVDSDGIVRIDGISTGEGQDQGAIDLFCPLENHSVTTGKTLEGEAQTTELIEAVGIGPGEVIDDIGLKPRTDGFEGSVEMFKIHFIIGTIGEANIKVTGGFYGGVIVFLMDGKREDIGVILEDKCATLSMMDVEVNEEGSPKGFFELAFTDGDGDVVEHTESFPVIGEGMMESAADMDSESTLAGDLGSEHGSTAHDFHGFHDRGRPWDFHDHDFRLGEAALFNFIDVSWGMDEEEVSAVNGFGFDNVKAGFELGFGFKTFDYPAVFIDGKDVVSEVHFIVG